jgi:putative NADH-flavin reductase
MTTIAVIGVTGYAGGHIASEALRRGYDVIGVSRSSVAPARPGLTLRPGSISDEQFMREIAEQASVIVVATHASENDESYLAAVVPSLLKAASDFGTRLGFVGGAGSLLVSSTGPRLVDTPAFPEMFKLEAESHAQVLEALRTSDSPADWFYVSPAAGFGGYAPGERTGSFRIGGDVLLADAEGNSFVSGEDFAIAFVDEIDTPVHHRERFSVAY